MQRPLSGGFATCRTWPKSPQLALEASRSESLSDHDSSLRTGSWPRQTSLEPCTNVSSLCQDPQTEFALLRQSMGVGRINHVLRVHGLAILQEQRAAEIHGGVGQRSLERLRASRKTAWHSAQALELDTRERDTARLQRTWVHS